MGHEHMIVWNCALEPHHVSFKPMPLVAMETPSMAANRGQGGSGWMGVGLGGIGIIYFTDGPDVCL